MFDRIRKIFSKIKDLNASVDEYRQDSIIQSLPTVAYVNKAKKFFDSRNYDEAEKILKEALDISSQDALVYKYLGKINECRHQFAQAVIYYQNSSTINPNDKEIWLRLGMCQLYSKDFENAILSFEKADKVNPLNTDVQTGWGMALMRQKKYALAHDKFLLACRISKYNYSAILLSAVMEVRLCDYKSAEEKLKFLNKVAPNETSTYEYANLKLIKNDLKTAEEYAIKSLQINKQMLPSYFVLGEVYSLEKDLYKTENTFNTAIQNGLDCESLQFEWGKACVRFFEFENAQQHFTLALQKDENYLDAKIGIALVCALNNNFEPVDELKEKYGNNVYIQEAIGLKYFSQEKYDDAVEMFKKALKTDKTQTYNYLHLVYTYQKLNNKDKIRENFDKFIMENPNYIEGIIEYAKWLISMDEYNDALRKLRKAEKIKPQDLQILNLIFHCSYILAKQKVCEYNVKEAISIAEKIKPLGTFEYENEKLELENILKDLQGNE